LTPSPIGKVLSTLKKHRVRALLMGGQACILYGAAEFSRDVDVAVLAGAENLARLRRGLGELRAERKPFYTVAAGLSLVAPLVAVVVFLFLALNNWQERVDGRVLEIPLVVLVACFGLGWASLAGVKANGALSFLLLALTGIIVSAMLGLAVLILLAASRLSLGP
jgi:hypothetical protein